MNESRNFLSEKFRIRIVPSLTTLKLIQDSSADYHSGALIVGDPDVGGVLYKGDICKPSRLSFCRKGSRDDRTSTRRSAFVQGLEGYSRDPGFDQYTVRDSGKRKIS